MVNCFYEPMSRLPCRSGNAKPLLKLLRETPTKRTGATSEEASRASRVQEVRCDLGGVLRREEVQGLLQGLLRDSMAEEGELQVRRTVVGERFDGSTWVDAGAVQRDVDHPGRRVRHLRVRREGSQASCRSQPRDGRDSRSSVQQLQPRNRAPQGKYPLLACRDSVPETVHVDIHVLFV